MHHEHKSEKRVRISAYPKPKGIIPPKNVNYVYSLLLFLTCMNNQTVVGPLTSIVFFYFFFDLILWKSMVVIHLIFIIWH